jgi:catechol 2,3-dioxygenase
MRGSGGTTMGVLRTIELGAVGLSVGSLERSLAFYRDAIGMSVLEQEGARATLGVAERPLLVLEERPGARRDPAVAGLYHFALLLPSRAALGVQLRHLLATEVKLTGAADHHVSEALYLDDPDGHGIEVYRDRPRAEWRVNGRIHLTNTRLDRDGILAAGAGADFAGLDPGTVMGHVHLESRDVPAARAFYLERLGFEQSDGHLHVAFMSIAGYHHHVAVNDWEGRRRPAAPDAGGIGLLWYEIGVPQADMAALAEALPEAERAAERGALVAHDADGIPIYFVGSPKLPAG